MKTRNVPCPSSIISHKEQLITGHTKQKVASCVQAMHGSVRSLGQYWYIQWWNGKTKHTQATGEERSCLGCASEEGFSFSSSTLGGHKSTCSCSNSFRNVV